MNISDKPTPPVSEKGYCIEGFKDMLPDNDYCYKIEANTDSLGDKATELWSEAEMKCREQGAQLASFHSVGETAAVLLQWNPKSDSGLWIGGVAYRKHTKDWQS